MIEILVFILGLFFVVPAVVYLCAKMITVGILQGRKSFEDSEEQDKVNHNPDER